MNTHQWEGGGKARMQTCRAGYLGNGFEWMFVIYSDARVSVRRDRHCEWFHARARGRLQVIGCRPHEHSSVGGRGEGEGDRTPLSASIAHLQEIALVVPVDEPQRHSHAVDLEPGTLQLLQLSVERRERGRNVALGFLSKERADGEYALRHLRVASNLVVRSRVAERERERDTPCD